MDRMQGHAITAAYAAALAGIAFKVNSIVKDPYMVSFEPVSLATHHVNPALTGPVYRTKSSMYPKHNGTVKVLGEQQHGYGGTMDPAGFVHNCSAPGNKYCLFNRDSGCHSKAIARTPSRHKQKDHKFIRINPGLFSGVHVLHLLVLYRLRIYLLRIAFIFVFKTKTIYVEWPGTRLLDSDLKMCCAIANITLLQAALISLLFRQTNIIWLVFTMGISTVDLLSVKKKKHKSTALYNPAAADISSLYQCLQSVQSLLTHAIFNLHKLIPQLATYIFSICSFIAFLYWNKGIVLGDHSAHVAGLHFPQLFYFIAFLAFFTLPLTLDSKRVKYVVRQLQGISLYSIIGNAGVCLAILALIHKFTYEHPYLLADNRHYSFYLWRKVYKRHWSVRYLLAPAYMACGWLCYIVAAPSITFLFLLAYIAAIGLTLVPSPLLEFRYFIIPFYIFLVHIKVPNASQIMTTTVFYLAINAWTIWMFLHKGFIWDSEIGRVQRFIW